MNRLTMAEQHSQPDPSPHPQHVQDPSGPSLREPFCHQGLAAYGSVSEQQVESSYEAFAILKNIL